MSQLPAADVTGSGPDCPPSWMIPRLYDSVSTALAARRGLAGRLEPLLEKLLEESDPVGLRDSDPVSVVHRFTEPLDQEIVGLVASSLAFGNARAILSSVRRVLEVLGSRPSSFLDDAGADSLAGELAGFSHRWIRGNDVAALLHAGSRLQSEHGSLGELFASRLHAAGGNPRMAVKSFVGAFRNVEKCSRRGHDEPSKWMGYLLPDGSGGGACKRLHMYLRWMVRGPDEIDLGLWQQVPTRILMVPLDTHTSKLCRYLGLTSRKDASWRTAEEVTWNLRGIAPDDPVRYDFVLAHLGISRRCRHQHIAKVCGDCSIAKACCIAGWKSKKR